MPPTSTGSVRDLPAWAQRGLTAPTIEVTDDDTELAGDMKLGDDKNLPAWALKGLQR